MCIRDIGRVDPDQSRVASYCIVGSGDLADRVTETSQVDNIWVVRSDRQRQIEVPLVQQGDRVLGFVGLGT